MFAKSSITFFYFNMRFVSIQSKNLKSFPTEWDRSYNFYSFYSIFIVYLIVNLFLDDVDYFDY